MTAVVPSTSLTLAWNQPLDNGCLPIIQYTLSKNGADLAAVITPDQLTYTDSITSATIGTQITYKLKAINYAGASLYTENLVVTVGSVPNAPTGLQIVSRTQSSVEISWTADAAISSNTVTLGYKVYLNDQSGNPSTVVFDSTKAALTTTTSITGLIVGSQYLVTVTAVNAIGESNPSSALTVNVGTVPSKISEVTLQSSTSTTFTIQWPYPQSNGGLSLTQFTVYLDEGQTGTFSPVTVSDPNENYYQTGALTTGALVDVQVTAWNVNGESAKSDVRAFYVATIPSTPATPTQTNIYLTNGYNNPDAAV